jgi:hypothetical protein
MLPHLWPAASYDVLRKLFKHIVLRLHGARVAVGVDVVGEGGNMVLKTMKMWNSVVE